MDGLPRPDGQAASAAPCQAERAAVQVVCAEASAAREAHARAVETQQEARRRLASARRELEEALELADARRRAEKKRLLRERYQGSMALARDSVEREAAAATWAREIDALNRAARLAQRSLASTQTAVASVESRARDAEAEEHAARLRAETAEASCLDARVRLATCEERLSAPAPSPGDAGPVSAPSVAAAGGEPAAPGEGAVSAGTNPAPLPEAQTLGRIGAGPPLSIEGLVAGDRQLLALVAGRVAEQTGRRQAEAMLLIQRLLEAFAETAADHGHLAFDVRQPLWGRLSRDESSDLVRAFAGMGFGLVPGRGWQNGRAPAPSDLAVALAYAGIDARGMRNPPSAADISRLPLSVAVDSRAFLAAEAPDLALDRVVRALGERATDLGELWDDWGLVRPILLAPLETARAAGRT